jgi:hypothetical protein
METTKNKLTPYANMFFYKLSSYLDTPLYFYGSVQRDDYFQSASDIDVDIFTNDSKSTIIKIQQFLNLDKDDFKKVLIRLNSTNQVVSGHKLEYKEPENKFAVEFSIYNEKYKKEILEEHNGKKDLPYIVTILLIILKFLYYTLNILPKFIYMPCKNFILSFMIGKKNTDFVIIDIKDKAKELKKAQEREQKRKEYKIYENESSYQRINNNVRL